MTTYNFNQDKMNLNAQSPDAFEIQPLKFNNLEGVNIESNQNTPQINIEDNQSEIPQFEIPDRTNVD